MNYAEYFIQTNLIYLNSGTVSRTPESVIKRVQHELTDFEKNPTRGFLEAYPRLWQLQTDLAIFFGAKAKDLFLRQNITAALNTFVFSYPWTNGEILVTNYEYGACVNLIKVAANQKGLSVRIIDLPDPASLSEKNLVSSIVKNFRPETRGILLSHVCTGNGLVLPIQAVAEETRRRDIVCMVDGAHAPGSIPLDFSQFSNIDFYGGNLHKWMMGPKGTGFGWMPARVRDKLNFCHGGWSSFTIEAFCQDFGGGDVRVANLLPVGTLDVATYYGLDELLKFWNKIGPENIYKRIYELQSFLEQEFDKHIAWEKASPPKGPMRGPLLAYYLPESLVERNTNLIRELADDIGVQVNITKTCNRPTIRFSPHIYNTEAEISTAIERLRTYKARA